MTHNDRAGEISASTGIGRIRLSAISTYLPLFYIDFGKDQSSSFVEKFLQYKRIILTVTEINPFLFRYEIHSDILLRAITKEIASRVKHGEDMNKVLSEYPRPYAFQATQDIKRHWHLIFSDAQKESNDNWILLLNCAVATIIVIDKDGRVTGSTERPRIQFPDGESKNPE